MARILVIGSIAVDDVIALREPMREGGHMEGYRIGRRMGGSAANTAVALAHAGDDTALVCPIGNDDLGRLQDLYLAETGIDTSLIRRVEGASTNSIVMVDPNGERTIVNVARCREPEPPQRVNAVEADLAVACTRGLDLAPVLEMSVKRRLTVAHIPPCDSGARPAHILVGSVSDLTAAQLADPWALGQSIAGDCLRHVVITRGADGASVYGPDGARDDVPSRPVTPIDTTGAGDSFMAGLVHGLANGRTVVEAARIGCAFGAEATQHEASNLPKDAVAQVLKGLEA